MSWECRVRNEVGGSSRACCSNANNRELMTNDGSAAIVNSWVMANFYVAAAGPAARDTAALRHLGNTPSRRLPRKIGLSDLTGEKSVIECHGRSSKQGDERERHAK